MDLLEIPRKLGSTLWSATSLQPNSALHSSNKSCSSKHRSTQNLEEKLLQEHSQFHLQMVIWSKHVDTLGAKAAALPNIIQTPTTVRDPTISSSIKFFFLLWNFHRERRSWWLLWKWPAWVNNYNFNKYKIFMRKCLYGKFPCRASLTGRLNIKNRYRFGSLRFWIRGWAGMVFYCSAQNPHRIKIYNVYVSILIRHSEIEIYLNEHMREIHWL